MTMLPKFRKELSEKDMENNDLRIFLLNDIGDFCEAERKRFSVELQDKDICEILKINLTFMRKEEIRANYF